MERQIIKFLEKEILLDFQSDFFDRFKTPNFFKIKEFINENKISRKNWKETLNWFLFIDRKISIRSKLSIEKITILEKNYTFCIEMEYSSEAYQNLEYLAKNTGWYFYLTGIQLSQSIICKEVDSVKRKFKKDFFQNWNINENDQIELINISSIPNSTCFLLKLGKYNILLDAGMSVSQNEIKTLLESYIDKLDAIFISHTHFDHIRGIKDIIELYPNTIILCSQTTLDFFIYYTSIKMSDEDNNLKIKLPDINKKIIENTVNVSSGEKIDLQNGSFKFYFSGHMPGALMFNIDLNDYNFLYTGDFSFFDCHPISGVKSIIDDIQKPFDFILLDAAMCDRKYSAPKSIFDSLKYSLKLKAQYGNQVLIAADPASTAIILYITIFSYFRDLQLKEKFEHRPTIVMGRDTLEFVKIIQERSLDIHPVVRRKIIKQLNPFTSALTHFCTNYSEIMSFIDNRNTVFIFGEGDLIDGISIKLLIPIGKYKHNLIILTGALRSDAAIELASGNKEIIIDNDKVTLQADIYNSLYPDKEINLHADFIQIEKLINELEPKKIGLFHTTARKLIPIRANLLKKEFVKETFSFDEKIKTIKLR